VGGVGVGESMGPITHLEKPGEKKKIRNKKMKSLGGSTRQTRRIWESAPGKGGGKDTREEQNQRPRPAFDRRKKRAYRSVLYLK